MAGCRNVVLHTHFQNWRNNVGNDVVECMCGNIIFLYSVDYQQNETMC